MASGTGQRQQVQIRAREQLSADELLTLIERVFARQPSERRVAVLVDLPDRQLPDNEAWLARRQIAAGWVDAIGTLPGRPVEAALFAYRNVRRNNADLPGECWRCETRPVPSTASELTADDPPVPFSEVFSSYPLMLAPTELSATAPLKVAARQHGFRAATMPGFSEAMLPALRLDYAEVNRRVVLLKNELDRATAASLRFVVDGERSHRLDLDLRFRTAHASGGLLHAPGSAGNLPSGEAYIVPYEGERQQEPSRSRGELPVQIDREVVIFTIEENRATAVDGTGPAARAEKQHLEQEPAYGNLAELGLGVLADFGVAPIGQLLLDEKLGLHIAFGRSEHFGGRVGPGDFSRPEAVIHLDRVYLPSTQPRVQVRSLELIDEAGQRRPIIRDDAYVLSDLRRHAIEAARPQ